MNIKDLAEEAGLKPTWKAACHGGEYCSPCPFCKDGDDRFLLWPNRPNKDGSYQGGRYQCPRHCKNHGDAIEFLKVFHGMKYPEACARLKLTPKPRNFSTEPRPVPKPLIAADPPLLWQEKAGSFANWAHEQLMRCHQAKQQILRRGLTEESIKRFKIGFNPGNDRGWDFYRHREEWGLEPQLKEDGKQRKLWLPKGFTVPTFSSDDSVVKVKVRRSAWHKGDKLPKYVEVSGSKQAPSVYGDITLEVALVLESELDALLVQQEASDLVFCVALGGNTKSLDFHTDKLLRNTRTILFCPDFDQGGAAAWQKWKRHFPHTHRILTPEGKAPGDAFSHGINLRDWVGEAIK